MSELSLAQLTNRLNQSHINYQQWQNKLEEINHIRNKVNSQLDILSKDYETKIKHLQSKLSQSVTQNQKLKKQNKKYQKQLESFQNLLIEKDAFIEKLLTQAHTYAPTITNDSQNNRKQVSQILPNLSQKNSEPKIEEPIINTSFKNNEKDDNKEEYRDNNQKQQIEQIQSSKKHDGIYESNNIQEVQPQQHKQQHNKEQSWRNMDRKIPAPPKIAKIKPRQNKKIKTISSNAFQEDQQPADKHKQHKQQQDHQNSVQRQQQNTQKSQNKVIRPPPPRNNFAKKNTNNAQKRKQAPPLINFQQQQDNNIQNEAIQQAHKEQQQNLNLQRGNQQQQQQYNEPQNYQHIQEDENQQFISESQNQQHIQAKQKVQNKVNDSPYFYETPSTQDFFSNLAANQQQHPNVIHTHNMADMQQSSIDFADQQQSVSESIANMWDNKDSRYRKNNAQQNRKNSEQNTNQYTKQLTGPPAMKMTKKKNKNPVKIFNPTSFD